MNTTKTAIANTNKSATVELHPDAEQFQKLRAKVANALAVLKDQDSRMNKGNSTLKYSNTGTVERTAYAEKVLATIKKSAPNDEAAKSAAKRWSEARKVYDYASYLSSTLGVNLIG